VVDTGRSGSGDLGMYQLTVLQVKRPNQQHQSTEGKVGQPVSHRPEEAQNPPGASHLVTSEPLKKEGFRRGTFTCVGW